MTSTGQPTSPFIGAASKPVVPGCVGAADLVVQVSVLLVRRVVLVLLGGGQKKHRLLAPHQFFFVPSSSYPYSIIRLLFYSNFVDSWFHYSRTSQADNDRNLRLLSLNEKVFTTTATEFLTSCRMVSVRARCQSTMMLSVSYCIRNSTPFLVFNWGGGKGDRTQWQPVFIETESGSRDGGTTLGSGVESANKPLKHSFCWICLLRPSKYSLLSGPPWTLGQSDWFCSAGNNKNYVLHSKKTKRKQLLTCM